jgi:hypothetical protein
VGERVEDVRAQTGPVPRGGELAASDATPRACGYRTGFLAACALAAAGLLVPAAPMRAPPLISRRSRRWAGSR